MMQASRPEYASEQTPGGNYASAHYGSNQPGMNQHYNGNSNVTYAYGGGLPTTKQAPPATSGSVPTRQPPISSAINGYTNNQQQMIPGYNHYQPPMQAGYGLSPSMQGHQHGMAQSNNNQPPPTMQYGQPQQSYVQHGYPSVPSLATPRNQPTANGPCGDSTQSPHNSAPPPIQQSPPPMSQPQMQQPAMSQPPMGQLPMSQPQMGQPPMSQPQMGQPPISQPPTQQLQNMSLLSQPNMPPLQPPPGPGGMMPPSSQSSSQYPAPPGALGAQIHPGPPQPGMLPHPAPGIPPQPGMLPQPGMSQQPGMPGTGMRPSPYPNQAMPAPAKRLDPDAMPSPIQVIEQDKLNNHAKVFRTEGRGLVPPLVTTKFTVEDLGSASPRYIRCCTYNLPSTADMAKQCQVPMSINIKPMAKMPDGESAPLVVDPGTEGPIRCKRCKTYMCPQFAFTDGGRRFQCHMCNAITDTPHYYFNHIDHMNQRVDKHHRPELCRGSYEFIATKDYCRNDKQPKPPAFIFAIDVSYNSIKSGMVHLLCRQLQHLLDSLPKDHGQEKSLVRVGFFTYSNVLHFYNLNSSLAQPQMMVVSDVNDIFVPLQDGFLVDLDESRHVLTSLLEQIPDMFRDTRETELIFAPVIQAAVQALTSDERAGKLLMFHSSLPIGEAPGKLKNRDDRKLVGTDKERTLFSPAGGNHYEKLGKECVASSCSVDLFLFPNQYTDVATLAQVPNMTGGQVYKYNFFRPQVDGERFIRDLAHNLQRDIVFDAIMRVRTSTGIRAVEFIGALYMSNTTDVELAAIDCDKSLSVELKHDDKIDESLGAFVQVALLYTSLGGQRRLRLHNLCLSVCTQLADLYRSCETDAIMNFLAKKSIRAGLQMPTAKIREDLISQMCVTLGTYRKHCAAPTSPGQLILPECMKLIPAYLNCLLKNDAIHSSHDISTDDRSHIRNLVLSMDVSETQAFFYPRLIPVTNAGEEGSDGFPRAIRCSEERLMETEVYIMENTVNLFLWIGQSVNPEWIHNVFGVQSAGQIDIDLGNLMVIDNDDSRHVRGLIEKLQAGRTNEMKLTIIRQRDKLEPWFKHYLVEDRGSQGNASYVDFLCHMHKEIRTLLT